MSDDPALAQARRDAAAAREQLFGNAQALQERLNPAVIAGNVWQDVCGRGGVIADEAARVVAKRPATVSLAALGITALLFRKPIARLFTRLRKRPDQPPTRTKRIRRTPRHHGDNR
jgi:hypothetical protein